MNGTTTEKHHRQPCDIERVPIENLQAFYKKYYRPDNAVLILGGNLTRKKHLP